MPIFFSHAVRTLKGTQMGMFTSEKAAKAEVRRLLKLNPGSVFVVSFTY